MAHYRRQAAPPPEPSGLWARLWPTEFMRWGGLASILAGMWWLIVWGLFRLRVSGDQRALAGFGPLDFHKLTVVTWLLLAIAISSLWLHMGVWRTQNRVLFYSYIAAMVGLGALVVAAIVQYWTTPWGASANPEWMRQAYGLGNTIDAIGVLTLLAGLAMLGIANFRFKALPRWNAIPFVVVFTTAGSVPFMRAQGATDVLFALGWIVLGMALWPGPAVDRHPERRRATRMRRLQ